MDLKKGLISSLFLATIILDVNAKEVNYELDISKKTVNFTGKDIEAMSVNNSIPGPTINVTEGDTLIVKVNNKMNVKTSVHWHGLILPNLQDGVSYLTTPPILPNSSYTYNIPITHSGTYWYHSHTGFQEQKGVYGSIVIQPKTKRNFSYDREHVVVISDWTDENPKEILRNLKRGSEYYGIKKNTIQSVLGSIQKNAFSDALKRTWSRMPAMDISDVAYDRFLINGKEKDFLEAKPGEKVLLRIINAGASSYFYLNYAGSDMKIMASDGVDIKPIKKDRLLMAIAETYDVLVTVPKNGMYEFQATAQDGSGSTSLFIGSGKKKIKAVDIPKPNMYKMMDHKHSKHQMNHNQHSNQKMNHDQHSNQKMNHNQHSKHQMNHNQHSNQKMKISNQRPMTPYQDLMALKSTALDKTKNIKEYKFELNGDMQRYVWSMNGKTLAEADFIKVKKGENVRFKMINKTMMHHPMHLHGHFFRVVNKHGDYSPLKHTVDVPPMGEVTIEFLADKEKDWFFHCHLLYHMKSGMARVVSYEGSIIDPIIKNIRKNFIKKNWYFWGQAGIQSNLLDGFLNLADTRNTFNFSWEYGLWNGNYETEINYKRYFNRFFETFIRANFEKDEIGFNNILNSLPEMRGEVGFEYLLPFLFRGQISLGYQNNQTAFIGLRLNNEWQLTNKLVMDLNLEYNPGFNFKDNSFQLTDFESEIELEYILSQYYSLLLNYNNQYGYNSNTGFGSGLLVKF